MYNLCITTQLFATHIVANVLNAFINPVHKALQLTRENPTKGLRDFRILCFRWDFLWAAHVVAEWPPNQQNAYEHTSGIPTPTTLCSLSLCI